MATGLEVVCHTQKLTSLSCSSGQALSEKTCSVYILTHFLEKNKMAAWPKVFRRTQNIIPDSYSGGLVQSDKHVLILFWTIYTKIKIGGKMTSYRKQYILTNQSQVQSPTSPWGFTSLTDISIVFNKNSAHPIIFRTLNILVCVPNLKRIRHTN